MGKRLNLIQRGSYQARSYMAVQSYNKGLSWHCSPWKKTMKSSPGKYFTKFINAQTKSRRQLQFPQTSTPQRNRNFMRENNSLEKKSLNTYYGQHASQPDLTEDQVAEECARILDSFNITRERRDEIQELTIGQFSNTLYRCEKSQWLTASHFGAVVKRRNCTPCHSLVKTILYPHQLTTEAIEYGKIKESVAISLFEEILGTKVQPCGLFVDLVHPFLGASPDGVVDDTYLV